MIKEDEILLIRTILEHCIVPYDMLPTEEIEKLPIPPKRINYLLHKMSHFIEYGVNIWFGWICETTKYIKDYYKNTHNIIL